MEIKQNLIRYALILLLPAACLCCKTKGGNSVAAQPGETTQVSDTLRQLMASWKADSLGCDRKRSKEAAESLLRGMKLENGSMKDFTEVFGPPNRQNEHEKGITLMYYFESVCLNGRLPENSDYCAAEFSFREGRLAGRHYICL